MTAHDGLDAVKAATWALHTRAERSGIVADILAGTARRDGVALLLRNLLPVYQVLDASRFSDPGLARAPAIAADLQVLSPDALPALLPEGRAYAERVEEAAQRSDAGLIAHAYVRYLGDLNGGQIMQRRLVECLGASAGPLHFHAFPALADPAGFTRSYRTQLDQAVRGAGVEHVVPEAMAAFELNVALSEAVRAWSELAAPN
jgi:heme oxygenase